MSTHLALGAAATLAGLAALGARRGTRNHWHHRRIPGAGVVYDTLLDRTRRSPGFRAWMRQEWQATPQEWDPDDLDTQAVQYLEDELELTPQGQSGYPAPRYLDPESARLLERLPFELHHATSSEILELIEEQGQLRGAKAQHQITDEQFSSAAGLYLSSDFGHAFGHYGEIAEDRWGGEAVAITVLVFAEELQPDPDDANLGSGRHQWITPSLPVSRIVRIYPSRYDPSERGSRAMAPGYRSWAWTTQDWRSVIPKRGGKVDYSKKCGAKGTRSPRDTPALCLPREICERLSASASGRRILHDQAARKWKAKKGERVPWHPRIRELHREIEARTPGDRRKPR
jgi:hypothetical protein